MIKKFKKVWHQEWGSTLKWEILARICEKMRYLFMESAVETFNKVCAQLKLNMASLHNTVMGIGKYERINHR